MLKIIHRAVRKKTKVARNTETGEVKERREGNGIKDLGKTIGDPKLSKEAQKYYEKLKRNTEIMILFW